ncbi:MAG TPA: UdgX family uracil-DNA binding protein [Bauldia sp.]|nr:UdgX family uracil-DNA binding protein [Bauldia sp.]
MTRNPLPQPDLFARGSKPATPRAEGWPPDTAEFATLAEAREAAASCTRCPLYRNATQTVFGEGARHARLMLVGEQPGDQEDLQGHVFVGPAGKVLDRALADAGIDRASLYVTNGVKHFKNEPRGKKRLHKRPDSREIDICRWWLDFERRFVRPKVVVALGASGLRAITGRTASITSMRGTLHTLADGTMLSVTVHPSFLLRMPDRALAKAEYADFVRDLAAAAAAAG